MEIQILEWINSNLHGSSVINQIFRFITYLGEEGICWLITGIVLLFFRRTRKVGLLMLAGYASVAVLNSFILKNIIDRPRPFTKSSELADFITSIGMELPTSSSCPSGHTAISMTSAIILTMSFKKKGAWSFIPAVLISLSRIFLCVHYPTDVLAGVVEGVVLGISVTLLGRIILTKLESWWLKRKNTKQLAKDAGEVIVNDNDSASHDVEERQEIEDQLEKEEHLDITEKTEANDLDV